MKRRITSGSTRALIDWYVATRSVPGLAGAERGHVGPRRVEPVRRSPRRGGAAASPASVIEIARGPPGRSTSFSPTIRSSAAICWLTADWV